MMACIHVTWYMLPRNTNVISCITPSEGRVANEKLKVGTALLGRTLSQVGATYWPTHSTALYVGLKLVQLIVQVDNGRKHYLSW